MSLINDLDLKEFTDNSVNNVFNTMLSMELKQFEADSQVEVGDSRIVGSVSFAGKAVGTVRIHVTTDFAKIITCAMLDMELDEVEDEEVTDVIGELSNMVGGNLKSRFCDSGLTCAISIPSITKGSNFKIESMDWERCEYFGFRYQEYTALVEVVLKQGN